MTTNKDRYLILSLLVLCWVIIFFSSVALFSPRSLSFLGLTTLLGGVGDTPSLWREILKTSCSCGILVVFLVGLRRIFSYFLEIGLMEFLLLLIGPATGFWVSCQRFLLATPSADLLEKLEPAILGALIPLTLPSLGVHIVRVFFRPKTILRGKNQPFAVYIVFTCLAGAVGWALFLYLTALAGFWKKEFLWFSVLAVDLIGLPRILMDLRRIPRSRESENLSENRHLWFPFFLLLVLIHGSFQLACLPPDDSDELRYHLSIPKRYLEAGGWTEIPDQAFSHFPLGMEMLFAPALSLDFVRQPFQRLGFVSGGKWIHNWFFVLSLLTLWCWAGDFQGSKRHNIWVLWIFATIPFVPVLASWAFVDFGVSFSWLASCYFAYSLFRKGRESQSEDPKTTLSPMKTPSNQPQSSIWTVGVGFALGWGLMVKYTSLAWYAFLGGLWFLLCLRNKSRLSFRNVFRIIILPLVLVSPWFIHNLIRTGNPTYPLLSSFFRSGFSPVQKSFYAWHSGMKGNLNQFWSESIPEKAVDIVTLPFRASLFPWLFEYNPLGGLLIALLPVFFIGISSRKRQTTLIGASSLFLFLIWSLTYRDPRFALPLWGLLSLGIGLGLGDLFLALEKRFHWSKVLEVSIVLLLVLWGVGQNDELFRRLYSYSFAITHHAPVEEYLRRRLPVLPVVREVEHLRKGPEGQTRSLLLLGQEQSYYFDSPVRGADYFDGPWLADIAKKSKDLKQMSEKIHSLGIDWVFINRGVLEKHPFNVVRGALFCMDEISALKELELLKRSSPLGLNSADQTRILREAEDCKAFRRMHAWLIRHPGFEEIPLNSVPPGTKPVSPFYRSWLRWPELRAASVEHLPRREFSLLRWVSGPKSGDSR